MIYYTGVGARATPPDALRKMMLYGSVLGTVGYTLRSGAAEGADMAFEMGCDTVSGKKEIYLPWQGYNGYHSDDPSISDEAFWAAERVYGSRWQTLSHGVRCLMARNIYQVLGKDLDTPSTFLICWTPDGARTGRERSRTTGGTGQAIECASNHLIPVFNLYNEGEEDRLLDFIGKIDD